MVKVVRDKVFFLGPLVAAVLLCSSSAFAQATSADQSENGAAGTAGDGTKASAESVETLGVAAAPVVAAVPRPVPLLDERTAYMVGRHTLKLGVPAFEYGILQQLSVGTDPVAWSLRAFIEVIVPNFHLKYQILDREPVAIAILVAGYYGSVSRARIDGSLIDVPLSLFVSVKVHPRITLHAEGTYVYARVFGTGDVTQASLNGATVARAGQLGLMLQYRLTRIFSVTATGRYQFYVADLPLSGGGTIDAYTTATLSGQYVPAVQHPWEAIGGVVFLWHYVHLSVGAGYGYFFVPGLDIANPRRTFVPDASFSVVL